MSIPRKYTPMKDRQIEALKTHIALLEQAIRDASVATIQHAKVSLPNFVDKYGPVETRLTSAVTIERTLYSGKTTEMVQ